MASFAKVCFPAAGGRRPRRGWLRPRAGANRAPLSSPAPPLCAAAEAARARACALNAPAPTPPPPEALVVTFALEELRRAFGRERGADPHDPSPFRAFRARLLDAAARAAVAPAALSFWWEGTFNGYALAVEALPAEALPGFGEAAAAACPVESVRLAPPRGEGYPLALVRPGGSTLQRGEDGLLAEAPFGAAAGHFGAPGVRRIP